MDPATLATPFPGVWALGDVAALPLPGRHRPDVPLALPKAGVFAHRQAEVVAVNVAACLAGCPQAVAFDGVGFCFVETGEGKAGFGVGRFFAEPAPEVRLLPPAAKWHWGKVFFERAWLAWAGGGWVTRRCAWPSSGRSGIWEGDEEMRLGLVIYSPDAETVWNAFRLGVFALKEGDEVSAFLLAKGVECDRLDSQQFPVTAQMREFLDWGGRILACGTCLKLRAKEETELCPLSTMADLYRLVRECDRVLTF